MKLKEKYSLEKGVMHRNIYIFLSKREVFHLSSLPDNKASPLGQFLL